MASVGDEFPANSHVGEMNKPRAERKFPGSRTKAA